MRRGDAGGLQAHGVPQPETIEHVAAGAAKLSRIAVLALGLGRLGKRVEAREQIEGRRVDLVRYPKKSASASATTRGTSSLVSVCSGSLPNSTAARAR